MKNTTIVLLFVIWGLLFPDYVYSALQNKTTIGHVHFIELPVDHKDPSKGTFSGYYVVGPNQSKVEPPVLFLADGQMNMISPKRDCSDFFEWFAGAPFILPCVRGYSPELLLKCQLTDGTVDIEIARNVFASWQQIEDIELIRKNLIQEGILSDDGKISIYGASGGGILAQEFVTKYPDVVHKLILESTGSPEIAKRDGTALIRNLVDYDAQLALEYELLRNSGFREFEKLSYVLYNLGRMNENASNKMIDLVRSLENGDMEAYKSYLSISRFNLDSITGYMTNVRNIGCQTRMCEIWKTEIFRYQKRNRRPVNLGYEWVSYCLSDYLKNQIGEIVSAPYDLSGFSGETLVIAGTEDVVFSPDMARSMAKTCKHSVVALLVDGHSMEKNWDLVCELRREFLRNQLSLLLKNPKFCSIKFEE